MPSDSHGWWRMADSSERPFVARIDIGEARLRRLARRAEGLVALLVNCTAAGQPEMIEWDDFPTVTVERILSWAHVEAHAAFSLLRSPAEAPAAEILLRGLLEALAHLSWILEPGDAAEQRCRAICYELGRVQSYGNGLRKMGPEAVAHLPPDIASQVESDLDTIRQLHQAAHCHCHARQEGLAGADLKRLARGVGQPWIYELWVTSSTTAHQFMFDRIAHSSEPGVTRVTGATLAERARLLTWTAAVYGHVGQVALVLVNPGEQTRFVRAVQRVTKSRALLALATATT